jgi:predicted transcriptional regulator
LYHPLVDEGAYKAQESRSALNRLFGGSFRGLVASLVEGDAIGEGDLEDLRAYLDELEGKK